MKRKTGVFFFLLFGLPLFLLFAVAAPARADSPDPWRFDLYLYFWPAGLSGDLAAEGHCAHTRLKFDDILHDLKMGANGAFEVSKGDWFFLNDFIYLDVSHKTSEMVPPGVAVNATLDTRILMDMAAVGRQWETAPVRWKAFFGARYFYGRVRLDAIEQLGPSDPEALVVKTDEWVTPVVGGGFDLPFNERLSFHFLTDVGAADRSFNWEVIPSVGWTFNPTLTALAGYRLLDVRHKQSGFKVDSLMHGPIVGLKISF